MALIVQNQVIPGQVAPIPTDIGVIADEFDLSTITTGDAIFAAVAIVGSVLLSWVAKRALRRIHESQICNSSLCLQFPCDDRRHSTPGEPVR